MTMARHNHEKEDKTNSSEIKNSSVINDSQDNINNEPTTYIEEQNKELEYLELAQRIKAEFENYKKRTAEIATMSFNNGVASCVEKLLPALDSFKQAKSSIIDEDTLKGINLIYDQIFNALKSMGIEKIDAIGKIFDPNYHNAVMVDKVLDKPDGEILEEFQEGFMLGNRVVRHSVVKINKLT